MLKLIIIISDLIIPIVITSIIIYGYSKKVSVYDIFISGAKDGLETVVSILPTLIGLMVAVAVLRASGALDIIINLISPLTDKTGFPGELVPLGLMRLVSSSAATGILLDIFKEFGPDSFIGRVSSVMMGCTETVFYTMSVYFMSVSIKNTRYTLAAALIANVAGVFTSFFIVLCMFGK